MVQSQDGKEYTTGKQGQNEIDEMKTPEVMAELGLPIGHICEVMKSEDRQVRLIRRLWEKWTKADLYKVGPIQRPADIAKHLTAQFVDTHREHFVAVCLDARNCVLESEVISIGSLNASLVHPREVFKIACNCNAASIIMAHNHPSGDLTPSREDIELTRRMVQAGEIMGVEVLDHLIIAQGEANGKQGYLSMKEAELF